MPMHRRHAPVHVPVCTISILWNFHTNPYRYQYTSPVKPQLETTGVSAGETSGTKNYELHGKGWATRAPVAETLQTGGQFKSYIVT
jgi:hypothetical protein